MGVALIYKKTGSTNYDILFGMKELMYYTKMGSSDFFPFFQGTETQKEYFYSSGAITLGLAFILFSIT